MYEYIRGRLSSKNPTQVVLDVGGVGYRIAIPVSTFEKLGDPGQEVQLFAHLYVRDDALRVYGFATEPERAMFEMLIAVAGIGPTLALTILSGIPAGELVKAISEQNTNLLQTIKGIGKKTAQHIFLELKYKLKAGTMPGAAPLSGDKGPAVFRDALAGLANLGYAEEEARSVLEQVFRDEPDLDVAQALRQALKNMAKSRE